MEAFQLVKQFKSDFEKRSSEDKALLKVALKEYIKKSITLEELFKITNGIINQAQISESGSESNFESDPESGFEVIDDKEFIESTSGSEYEVIDSKEAEFYVDDEDDFGVIKSELERTVYYDTEDIPETQDISKAKKFFFLPFW
jgi:hypothetical protein